MFGKNNGALAQRMAGVMVPTTGDGTRGAPRKLQAAAKADVILAQYTDINGQVQAGLFFKIGDEYYSTKDTELWCKTLQPMSAWLKVQVEEAFAQQAPADLPKDDAVDVLGTGG